MRNARAGLLVLIGFVSGALSATCVWKRVPARSPTDIASRTEHLDALAEEIALDAQQRARLREISDRSHQDVVRLQTGFAPALAAIRSDVRSQIRAMLTREQQSRFEAYCARRDAQRAHADE